MREAGARWLDEQGSVAVDWPCLRCGYNLRTRAETAECPECGTPVVKSTPLRRRSTVALVACRRAILLVNGSLLLLLYGTILIVRFLDAIRPPRPQYDQIPFETSIRALPWEPWFQIFDCILGYGSILLVLLACRRYQRALVDLDLPHSVSLAGSAALWRLAVVATILTAAVRTICLLVSRTPPPWLSGIPEIVTLLLLFAILASRVLTIEQILAAAALRRFRVVSRCCATLVILAGGAIVVPKSLSSAYWIAAPQFPDIWVWNQAGPGQPPDYLIFSQDGMVRRSTIAPADALSQTEAFMDFQVQASSAGTLLNQFSGVFSRYTHWLNFMLGPALFAAFIFALGVVHRSIGKSTIAPPGALPTAVRGGRL